MRDGLFETHTGSPRNNAYERDFPCKDMGFTGRGYCMERFIKGDVVVIPFPFSDLTGTKRRPVFVVTDLPGDDIILCQITSAVKADSFTLPLYQTDFLIGSLPVDSFIRPNKIFTADKSLILYKRGHPSETKITEIINILVSLLQNG
jgi:mRNA interferase MazF